MDAESIAKDIAAYLKGRDDVADAYVLTEGSTGLADIIITTQGGGNFHATVAPTDA